MEQFREKIMPFVLLIGISFIVTLGVINFFRLPKNLKESLQQLEQTRTEIDLSLTLLKQQRVLLDSIYINNQLLLKDLSGMKFENEEMANSIKTRFGKVNNYLYTIKRDLDKVPKKKDTNID